jgi:hypothetical protein
VDFDKSGSFGQPSFRPYSEIRHDPHWLETLLYEENQSFGSQRLQVSNNSIQSPGAASSFATCPSLIDHSLNSSIHGVRTPRSYAHSGSFHNKSANSSFVPFNNQGEGFKIFHSPDTEIQGYTWCNSDTNENYAAINAFPQSEIQNNGLFEIPLHSTYNGGSTNSSQPIQYEDISFDFQFPTEQIRLPQDETQQAQFGIEEFPRRSRARAKPFNIPINTKGSLPKEKAFVNSNDAIISYDCFVMENGLDGNLRTELPRRKGSRNRPLSPDKAKITAERRKNATTCMRCRTMRVEVR